MIAKRIPNGANGKQAHAVKLVEKDFKNIPAVVWVEMIVQDQGQSNLNANKKNANQPKKLFLMCGIRGVPGLHVPRHAGLVCK